MVELPLWNLLMRMWCFSDCNVFTVVAIPFDVAAAVGVIIIIIVVLLQVQ